MKFRWNSFIFDWWHKSNHALMCPRKGFQEMTVRAGLLLVSLHGVPNCWRLSQKDADP